MSGVSDIAFRALCRKHGAALTTTEFISATAIARKNEKTLAKLALHPSEQPSSVQIFGSNLQDIITAAKAVERYADIIDLNLGCPVYKVIRQGAGSALLANEEQLYHFLKTITRHLTKPFTVKIRKGIDENHSNAVAVAKLCEKAGAAAITIHGRTQKQYFSGRADWDAIRHVKQAVRIPVIGNGDIRTPHDAQRMLEQTGCDYVMVGRGAIGRPRIFHAINTYLETGTTYQWPYHVQLDDALSYYRLASHYHIPTTHIRQQIINFTKGIPHSATMRKDLATLPFENIRDYLERRKQELEKRTVKNREEQNNH